MAVPVPFPVYDVATFSQADAHALVEAQRAYFFSGATLPVEARQHHLRAFLEAVRTRENAVADALQADLAKPAFEAYMTETGLVLQEGRHVLKKLPSWAKSRRVSSPMSTFPASSRLHPEPLGLTLIMAPWNYPFQLAVMPLIVAIAAGNCAIVKPSSSAPATSSIIAEIVAASLPPEVATVLCGNSSIATMLLEEKFDFIFYTGSGRVGRTVMQAAAKHLTPLCLELGGKSPVIVTADANLKLAAKRLAWGKSLNAGQTCIAPDYLLIDEAVKEEFVRLFWEALQTLHGPDILHSKALCRIVNKKAYDRLMGLANGQAVADEATLKIAPTILPNTKPEDPIMQEEIFGPLFPVLTFAQANAAVEAKTGKAPKNALQGVIDFIRLGDKPLALYLFTQDTSAENAVLSQVSFGGGCVNDVIMHITVESLPFGGVGGSGMGRYHGKAGFDLMSNTKGVVHQSANFDMPVRYPPYTEKQFKLVKKVLR